MTPTVEAYHIMPMSITKYSQIVAVDLQLVPTEELLEAIKSISTIQLNNYNGAMEVQKVVNHGKYNEDKHWFEFQVEISDIQMSGFHGSSSKEGTQRLVDKLIFCVPYTRGCRIGYRGGVLKIGDEF